jgi:ATP-binding cassette, subfamily B, bacterial MsbA
MLDKRSNVFYKIILAGRKHWAMLFVGFVMMLLGGFVSILPTWALKLVIDVLASGKLNYNQITINVIPQQLIEYGMMPFAVVVEPKKILRSIPIVLPLLFLLDGIVRFLHMYNTRFFGVLVANNLRTEAHEKLVSLSLPQIRSYNSGDLVSCLTNDLNIVQSLLAEVLTVIIKDSATALALGVWLLVVDWKLSLVAVTVLPLFFLSVLFLSKRIHKLANFGQILNGAISSFIAETVQGSDLLHLFEMSKKRHQKFVLDSNYFVNVWRKQILIDAMISPVLGVISAFGIGIVVWFGLNRVFKGNLTLGDFSSYIISLVLLYQPIKRLFRANSQISQISGTCERVFNLINSESSIPEISKVKGLSDIEKLKVELQDVSFEYHDQQKVLKNVDLVINEGDQIAIVGSSGSGKSTLIKLLPRLYEVSGGDIKINDVSIKDLGLSELRQIFSFVPQDPFLFTGTLKENLLLANPNASDQEIHRALSLAHVDFLNSLDDQIVERGLNFSGGQRQRIGIARAFLKNSPILIMDEPTSSLDQHSESLVKSSLVELMKNRTVILITHKLSLIKDFSRILYMKDGKIQEELNYSQLVESKDLYIEAN